MHTLVLRLLGILFYYLVDFTASCFCPVLEDSEVPRDEVTLTMSYHKSLLELYLRFTAHYFYIHLYIVILHGFMDVSSIEEPCFIYPCKLEEL